MRLLEIRRPLMRGKDVRQLQQLLAKAGYDPGPKDGVFGPRTGACCNHYKHDVGYKAGSCHPTAGGLLLAYLRGEKKPSAGMKLRALNRRRKSQEQRKRRKMRLAALAAVKAEIGTLEAPNHSNVIKYTEVVGLGRLRLLRHRHQLGVDHQGRLEGVQARLPLGEHRRHAGRRQGRAQRPAPALEAAARQPRASSTSTGTRTPTTPSPASASRATRS